MIRWVRWLFGVEPREVTEAEAQKLDAQAAEEAKQWNEHIWGDGVWWDNRRDRL